MSRKTITTAPLGVPSGSRFDGKSFIDNIEIAVVEQLVIIYQKHVYRVDLYYTGSNPSRGSHPDHPDQQSASIKLKPDEFIATVTGVYQPAGSGVENISFVSNLGTKWGPFGSSNTGTSFTWDYYNIESPPGLRMGLLYFTGFNSYDITVLQATFAEHPLHWPSMSQPKMNRQRRNSWERGPGILASLSPFARTLTSPVIVLHVGSIPVTFQASESILCRLPFFRAALQGEFREATDKIVTLPDDDPVLVASLLEFLYLGGYTYMVDTTKDSTEGSFHVALHALAGKYGCEELQALESRNVAHVLDGLDGLQVVRIVKEMFEGGWVAKEWSVREEFAAVKESIPRIIRQLYAGGGQELEILWAGCPGLAANLMILMV